MRSLEQIALGARAAWRTPAIISHGLTELLEAPSAARVRNGADPRLAVRAAYAAIARMARIAPTRWRNTCLYRSVAECLVLRAHGLPARVVIGVGTSGDEADVIAHAWVECEGVECLSTRGQAELETMTLRSTRVGVPLDGER